MINPLSLALPTAAGGSGVETVHEDFLREQRSAVVAEGTPFWGTNPNAWDTALIAGRAIPGRCVPHAKVKNRVDRKTIPGTHGAKATHIGYAPAEIRLEITIWTAQQLGELEDIIRLVRPRKTAPQPFTISHPSLSMLDISAMLVIEIDNLQQKGEAGFYALTIHGMEYVTRGNDKAKVETAKKTKDAGSFTNALSEETDKRLKDQRKPSAQNAKAP